MKKLIASIFTVCLGLTCLSAQAQSASQQPSPAPAAAPAAAPASSAVKPGDVDSIEHILAATYDVISGPAGPRDWDRFRSLFAPSARLIPTRRNDKGVVSAQALTPDEYSVRGQAFFSKEGFLKTQFPTKLSTGTTLPTSSAPMSHTTPRETSLLPAASTVFS